MEVGFTITLLIGSMKVIGLMEDTMGMGLIIGLEGVNIRGSIGSPLLETIFLKKSMAHLKARATNILDFLIKCKGIGLQC